MAASNTARIGTGVTFVLGTTDFTVEEVSFTQNDQSVPVIDTAHLGTTGARTKIPGDLRDNGDLTVEGHFSPNLMDTIPLGTVQTGTITFPVRDGEATAATCAGSGFISSVNFTVPLEDKCMVSFNWTWADDITWTDAT